MKKRVLLTKDDMRHVLEMSVHTIKQLRAIHQRGDTYPSYDRCLDIAEKLDHPNAVLQGQWRIDGKLEIEYDIGKPEKAAVFGRFLEYVDTHGLYMDVYSGCVEPGYTDQMVLAADWNGPSLYKDNKWDWNADGSLTENGKERHRMSKLGPWAERYFGDISLEWDDEWTACCECGKAVRISRDSYSWQSFMS